MAKGIRLKDADGPVYPCPFFPVGAIYISTTSTNPSTYFGGTWVEIQGRFLLGRSSSYAAGSQGGEASHKLTSNEMPSHNHSVSINTTNLTGSLKTVIYKSYTATGIVSQSKDTANKNCGTTADTFGGATYSINASHNHSGSIGSTGGNAAHNNMPPYLAVYIWKRTA